MRVAIYYAPEDDDPLWGAGIAWLGRDPARDASVAQPDHPGIADATASPRRYGFHATLKPPMEPAQGLGPLLDDVRELAAGLSPFAAPAFTVGRIDGFLAIVEATPSAALHALADTCVSVLDHHRVAEPAAVQARRAEGLDPTGKVYLERFGYPYVMDRWRFHMTLSERLKVPHELEDAARRHFAPACASARVIGGIALFIEPEPGAPFHLAKRFYFGRP
ncbi:MAG: DUF1045 domain-containing protein [Acidiphilium sp.]|nr:DUF1045 domain-containing protein [Acidiphilium sp.]MDD4935517.1 DUF1045 domain-containing protein [Acidiphilium sp.]